MSEPSRTEIATLGEFGLIEHLVRNFPLTPANVIVGLGDDAAVLDYSDMPRVVLSTDMLVEGVHFDLMYTPLKHLGYKAVAVNVSDIIAMNGVPRQITVSIAVSNRFSVEALDELYEGIRVACDVYNVTLIGGDTTSAPKGLVISVTVLGAVDPQKIVRRNTAKVGDVVCISGDLGSAYLGLQLLEREKQLFLSQPDIQPAINESHALMVGRQLKPEARVDIVAALRAAGVQPTSMIDISDGLASELFHICTQSKVGVLIEESGVPIHHEAQIQALEFGLDPITCALSGGEDYELLFTIDPSDIDKVKSMEDIYMAGEIVPASEGIMLRTTGGNLHPITAQGWNHFSKGKP